VDILAARQLHGEALLLAAAGGAVVVDCSRCERLDASALQILLALDAHFRERQATLRIVGGSPAVRAWLRVAGCASLLPAAHAGSPTDERTGGEIESAQNSAYRG
jgi:anti-anti-sigma regulatory factor